MRRAIRRIGSTMVAMTGAVAAAVIVVPVAEASRPGDGRCESGEVCFYWGSNYTGASRDYVGSVWDFGDQRYPNNGTGGGQRVKNNAASVVNRAYSGATVYYNEGYTGPWDYVAPFSRRNLNHTWNDNASYTW